MVLCFVAQYSNYQNFTIQYEVKLNASRNYKVLQLQPMIRNDMGMNFITNNDLQYLGFYFERKVCAAPYRLIKI